MDFSFLGFHGLKEVFNNRHDLLLAGQICLGVGVIIMGIIASSSVITRRNNHENGR